MEKGTVIMNHFVQGVITVEDEAYILEPNLCLANGETIAILYSDLRPQEEQEEDNPVSLLLEVDIWFEMLILVQIGLGDRKVAYSPALPVGTKLELASKETVVFGEVIRTKHVVQGIILDLNWDAAKQHYLAVAGLRVYTHHFVLIETAIGKMVLSYKALEEQLGEQVKQFAPGGYLEWEPARHDLLAIITKRKPD